MPATFRHMTADGTVHERTSKTMAYSHVVADDSGVYGWSQSLDGATKMSRRSEFRGGRVEEINGGTRPGTLTAEREAANAPAPKRAPKAEPKAATILESALLPAGAETDSPPSGDYRRVRVNGKSIGYISDRKAGKLVEVLTSRIADAPAALLKGTKVRQNQTALLVTDKTTAAQAAKLFALAAKSVQG